VTLNNNDELLEEGCNNNINKTSYLKTSCREGPSHSSGEEEGGDTPFVFKESKMITAPLVSPDLCMLKGCNTTGTQRDTFQTLLWRKLTYSALEEWHSKYYNFSQNLQLN